MAFTEGFEYDIFISYAHPDNSAPEGQKGWVDDFHEELEAFLVRRFVHKKIAIWRDKKLQGSTRFDNRIKKVINHSALFLALVSPHYLQSDYCRKELEWFYRQAKSGPFGISVKDENRLFNILLKNIPHTSWPGELSGASGFSMHDAPEKSEESGEPLDHRDIQFNKKLRKIVDAIETTLNDFPRCTIQNRTGDTEPEKVSIFIADTADTLQPTRDILIADLEGKNVHVPEPIPPPMKNKEHESSAAEAIQKANLTVHLLDELPGRKIIDCKTTTYPRQQLEIALHSETPQLIWTPKHLKYENFEDEDYKAFLQSLENDHREEKKYEFIRSDQTNLVDLILEKITYIQQEKQDKVDYASILLDTHQKDQLFAFELGQYLNRKGIKIEFNQESRNPLVSLHNFEEYLQHVRNLVIIFGQVTSDWVLERLKKTIKLVSTQLITFNEATLENLWIYLLPSSNITGEMAKLEKLFKIKYLDNRHSSKLDESVVEPLLTCCKDGSYA